KIFHPLRWVPKQALQFLKDVPLLESAGVVVRMPASWRMNRPARPQVKATVGGKAPSQLGMDALLDFRMEVTLDGERLSAAEIKQVLAQTLAALRHPDGRSRVDPGRSFQGALRPYQQTGVQWLHLLARLGLGACLADDMGLGKTIQVLSLLLVLKNEVGDKRKPCLIV